MNKKDLVSAVSEAMGSSKKEAALAVGAVFDVIANTVAKGEKVSLVGFGSFEATLRKERQCKNFQTGDMMTVPAKFAPKFKAGKGLKEAVAAIKVA